MPPSPDDPHLEAGVRSARLPCLGERPNCPLRPMPRKRALRCVHRVKIRLHPLSSGRSARPFAGRFAVSFGCC
jgi:hypothetical protein